MEILSAIQNRIPPQVRKEIFLSYQSMRSLTFAAQSLSLPLWEALATWSQKKLPAPRDLRIIYQNIQIARKDLHELLAEDAKAIAQGLYPLEVLRPESLRKFSSRYPKILLDGIGLARRRLGHQSKEFTPEAAEYLHELPEYFRRNFHYQTNGYLTEKSAELYEHQVEILFAGAADAMRRLLLTPLRERFPHSKGEGLHFLELGAGTGRMTRFVKLVFPKAKVTLLDLSYPYLKKAQERLQEFKRLDFIQGDAAHLPFIDNQFDAVYSCFLFHELPLEIRRRVILESRRVLHPRGFFGLVDSLQAQDAAQLDWALEQFPLDFHEPFYQNYLQNPMEGLLQFAGFQNVSGRRGFLAKVISGEKAAVD